MDPPHDHGDVVLARCIAEVRGGVADDRVAHLAGIERGRAPHRGPESLLAVLLAGHVLALDDAVGVPDQHVARDELGGLGLVALSLIHISEPTRLLSISYAVFCLKK